MTLTRNPNFEPRNPENGSRTLVKEWFVFYTKSRQEKKVNDLLLKKGYEPYLPLHTSLRQWSDRKKKVVLPLFNSYIFVRSAEYEIPTILTIPGMAWNIRYNGKPAILREEELQLIKRFIATGFSVETVSEEKNLVKGEKVKILDGPLAGVTGILAGDKNNQRFAVTIASIHQVIQVQIPDYLLEKA